MRNLGTDYPISGVNCTQILDAKTIFFLYTYCSKVNVYAGVESTNAYSEQNGKRM